MARIFGEKTFQETILLKFVREPVFNSFSWWVIYIKRSLCLTFFNNRVLSLIYLIDLIRFIFQILVLFKIRKCVYSSSIQELLKNMFYSCFLYRCWGKNRERDPFNKEENEMKLNGHCTFWSACKAQSSWSLWSQTPAWDCSV